MDSFGIDFGTTNSCALMLPGDRDHRFGDEELSPLPSIVVIDKATGQAFGGRKAWNRRLEYAERGGFHVITSIKRYLDADRHWFTPVRKWSIPEVVAFILGQLSDRVRKSGVTSGIQKATFGVPVEMSPRARRTLREAARIAGIEISGFIKESTAAFIRHYESVRHCRHVVIFDWGGGTLDVSVLEIRGRSLHELYTRGIPVAGNRIDHELASLVHTQIMTQRGQQLSFEEMPPDDRDELVFRCEMAKCNLARSHEQVVGLEHYGGSPAKVQLSRETCLPILEPIIKKAIDLLSLCIQMAGLAPEEIDQIIVIGGSSQLWLLPEILGNDPRFVGRFLLAREPEWDVAHGAATIEERPGKFFLNEMIALQLSDGTHFPLVAQGSVPTATCIGLSVALIEDSTQANILIDRISSEHLDPRRLLQFAVPAMGFDQEDIKLSYRLTEDLTFKIRGESTARGEPSLTEKETGELVFAYQLE
jgi:molecular chaperone DnaK